MQLRYLKSALPASENMCKVTSIAWSPNNRRLAVVTVDRIVHLFDASTGERKDKFSTKPSEKGDKNYRIVTLMFSPDSTKLAVAQSDNIVFIYKLGLDWGDKKSICNKFQQNSSVTSLTWPTAHPNEIVFGLSDGKVKVGQLRTNKPATLYSTGSYTCVVCSNREGNSVLSGHLDRSIYRFQFDSATGGVAAQSKISVHSCIPYALSWGESIVAAGSDKIVTFYDDDGGIIKKFNYQNDTSADTIGEFTVASFNPTGDTVVVGNYNCFFTYNFQSKREIWEQVGKKVIENMYSVTSLGWKFDGSRLAVGNLCGSVDLYDACIRRHRYKGKFEFRYVSISQAIIKNLSTCERVVIRSQFGCEILKMNIFQDRFLVANTSDTLLVGDLQTSKLSEIKWQSTEKEKYIFENESVCIVFQAGELNLIEYGQDEILGSVRTEHMNAHLLSVRINERPPRKGGADDPSTPRQDTAEGENKKVAYLLDLQTISVKDLCTHSSSTINHDARIDWLELNARGNLLIFRDKRRQLHLFDLDRQERTTLLNYCNYVQWVPDSDVVVAQNRSNLCVWYNIHAPDQATIYQIKGDVEEIERGNGKTEVIVDEGMNTASYQLDDSLIAFGTALDDRDMVKAVNILEPLELTPETEAMWSQLSEEALLHNDHAIAERCAAALGDVSCCRFLHKINKKAREETINHGEDGSYHWSVRSRLSQLRKDFRSAEDILLSQGQVEEAIEMYQALHKWEDAIRVAESKNYSEYDSMKRNYYEYLLESRQEEKAAALKEKEGDINTAINLYLKGGFPAKAAQLIGEKGNSSGGISQQTHLLETVATALSAAGMHEKAGEFFEKMDQEDRALEAYCRAYAYRKAVELARRAFPREVVRLEELWGDYLVSQKQVDMAINHYIEANVQTKAVEAALNSRQWAKAGQLVETLDEDTARPYYRRLARHYQDARSYEAAERCFIRADSPQDAVEMYTRINKWDAAHKVAVSYMSDSEVSMLYISQAQRMEAQSKYKEAEKLYLTVNEPDLAISMYKKQRKYDQMIRLVTKYRKDLLKETHMHLAQQLEVEGNLRESEHHYAEAGEWQAAVNMYRSNDMWDEAIRVAKYHGGINASKRVAYAWAMTLGGEAGSKLLTRLGLIEPAIDYAIESGAFDHAFELARNCATKKIPEVHLKHALFLEDEERFGEAEEEFIKAGKPREAVDMYIHQQDWTSAMRVAERADPSSVSDVFVAQARLCLERKDYPRAETLFVNANKPELILAAYQEALMWSDATRVAKRHLPHKVSEVNMAHQRSMTTSGHGNGVPRSKEELLNAGRIWENSQQFSQAIDAYLSVTAEQLDDPDALEEIWDNAVKLAASHERGRYRSVVEEVAQRLIELKKFIQAAELYKDIDRMHEAVDCYIRGKKWDEGRVLCQNHTPELMSRFEKAYHASVVQDGSPEEREAVGDVDNALEMWVQRDDWDKVFKSAESQGPEVMATYMQKRCNRLFDQGDTSTSIKIFAKYGVPIVESMFPLVEKSIRLFLGCSMDVENSEERAGTLLLANQVLKRVVQSLKESRQSDISPHYQALFDQLLLVSHYYSIRHQAQSQNLLEIHAKASMSLLRFLKFTPSDKAFYLAGTACRGVKWLSPAFVFLNRYLDLSEAIEDEDASMLDHADFIDTDIPPPNECELPKEQYLSNEQSREEIRDWVLTLSMDQKIQEKLPEMSCMSCKNKMYEASLQCPSCKCIYESCIITGFPIEKTTSGGTKGSAKVVSCSNCHVHADRESWNKWIKTFQTCPWCQTTQKMSY